jgi:hypothetical protein
MRYYKLSIDGRIFSSTEFENPAQITANVNDALGGSMLTADISIYNLSKESRGLIKQGSLVELEAGRTDGDQGVVFSGQVINSLSRYENRTDYITTMYCKSAANNPDISVTVKSSTAIKTLVESMCKAAELKPQFLGEFTSKRSKASTTVHGSFSSQMRNIGRQNRFFFKIRNNNCIIISDNYESETHQLGENQKFLGGTVLTNGGAKLVLPCNPKILPYDLVNVDAIDPQVAMEQLFFSPVEVGKGVYRATKINHSLDFYGAQWLTMAECVKV